MTLRVIDGRGVELWPVRRSGPYCVEFFLTKEEIIALGRLIAQLVNGDRIWLRSPFPKEGTAASAAAAQLHAAIRSIALAEIRSSFHAVGTDDAP